MARFNGDPIGPTPGGPPLGSGPFPPAPVPGVPAVPWTPPGGPRIASMFAPRGNAGHPTLQALMERQQELANRKGGVPQIQSWTQGAAHMLDQLFEGIETGRTNRRLAEGNQVQADVLSQADPTTGLISPEQLDPLASWNPELFYKLMSDYRQQQNTNAELEIAKQKVAGESGPKYNDVASMAQDFSDTPDVKAYQISQPRWISMQDAAQRDDAQSDLTMIIDSAKLSDPSSVVMTSEGEKVVATGGATDHLAAWFKYMTGTPGARLSRDVRLGLLREGYNRMNSYYTGVQSATQQYTDRAKRWGFEPADVVRPFAAPTQFDPEKVLGGAGVDTPPADPANPDTPQEAVPDEVREGDPAGSYPEGTPATDEDGNPWVVKGGKWVPVRQIPGAG